MLPDPISTDDENAIPLSEAPETAKFISMPEYVTKSSPALLCKPASALPEIDTSADAKPADRASADVASRTFSFFSSGCNKQIGLRQNLRRRNVLVVASLYPLATKSHFI